MEVTSAGGWQLSELDQALIEHMANIVFTEHRPFSFIDFLPCFEVNGKEYSIDYGTLRNKFSQLMKNGEIELAYRSNQAFYTMKGHKFGRQKLMTINHLGGASDPITKLISCLPHGNNSLHDIHLRFHVTGIWALLSTNSALTISPVSKDLLLPVLTFKGLEIRVTVHRSNTVSVVVGCSYAPIAVDCSGIIHLSNTLTRIEERLSRLTTSYNGKSTGASDSGISENNNNKSPISEYNSWIVTMWHFGVDSITEYTGYKFCATC